jgi:hypothetical protein
MLPLVSFSIRDSIFIKTLNFVFGLIVGGTLFVLADGGVHNVVTVNKKLEDVCRQIGNGQGVVDEKE